MFFVKVLSMYLNKFVNMCLLFLNFERKTSDYLYCNNIVDDLMIVGTMTRIFYFYLYEVNFKKKIGQ